METEKSFLINFEHELRLVSVNAALEVLNQRVAHRYTGVFELMGDRFQLRYIHDKQPERGGGFLTLVPVEESFCQVALREDGFRSDDTAVDDRLNYSPYKGVVKSYHAVPIRSADQRHSGTLCHFDVVERQILDSEFNLLAKAGKLLAPFVLGRF